MTMSQLFSRTRGPRNGFTLVELTVIIMILGVLAACGVPNFLNAAERSRAAQAFAYLSAVRAAQERYHARQGTYAAVLSDLDLDLTPPRDFLVGSSITAGNTGSLDNSWSLTLTREGASSGHGEYTVTFTEQGYDCADSTIDALPDINPVESTASFNPEGAAS